MTDGFKDEIRDRAALGETLYRVGVPSIGETYGRRYNASRDTGGLGTGVYAFTEQSAAAENVSAPDDDREVFELRNALSSPIRPGTFQATVGLNDASREAVRLIRQVRAGETTYADARVDLPSRLKRKARAALFDTPELRDRFGYDTDQFIRAWIEAAQTADMAEQDATTRSAVQPINLLLYPSFDGVYPRVRPGDRVHTAQ